MGEPNEEFQSAFWETVQPEGTGWIEWVHRSMGNKHCETCLNLDKCWFADDIGKAPELPLHPNCHCTKVPLPLARVQQQATAASAFSKYDVYLFNTKGRYDNHKRKMFEDWGYSVDDCQWLKDEIDRQGLEKYIAGAYTLGEMDQYGQRLSIRVEIPHRITGESVSFITGWMACPNGHIQLNTPYGGK